MPFVCYAVWGHTTGVTMGRSAQKNTEFDLLRVRLPTGYIQCLKECAARETEETGMNTTMSDIVRGQIGDYLRARGITPRRSKAVLRQPLQGFIPSGRDAEPVRSLYQVAQYDIELGAELAGLFAGTTDADFDFEEE
jgi:hypothetical protein